MKKELIHPEKLANFPKLFTQGVTVEPGGTKTVYVVRREGRKQYPNQWLLIDTGKAHTEQDRRWDSLKPAERRRINNRHSSGGLPHDFIGTSFCPFAR